MIRFVEMRSLKCQGGRMYTDRLQPKNCELELEVAFFKGKYFLAV